MKNELISKALIGNSNGTTHGHSHVNGKRSPTYASWTTMKSRCLNASDKRRWDLYGGRGVKVCERWLVFENFLSDMGERPSGTSLDRFPNQNGNYEPSNCRWATAREQALNKRTNHLVTFKGVTKPLQEWAEEKHLHHRTLWDRIVRGWSIDRALLTPTIEKLPRDAAGRFL